MLVRESRGTLELSDLLYMQFLHTILDVSTSHMVSKALYPVLEK